MKEEIIKTLERSIQFTDEQFQKGEYSHTHLIGYLQGTMKSVMSVLEDYEVKLKKGK